jgi:hypothetical protein
MIITKLQGGLANQLFQFAYGKYLSEKYQTELLLDITFYKNQFNVTQRHFCLNKFPNLKYKIFDFITNDKQTISIGDDFNYCELNYNTEYNYYLNGFWQSEKYFIQIHQIIKDELRCPKEFLNKFSYLEENNVSLHVRRTDYVTSNGHHPLQPISYYQQALDIIGCYDNLLVFSDDIEWCKNNLKFDKMIFIEGQDDIEDLWLMSFCKHNIIANSSFSWWGAWLNSNEDKKVIAPKNWFGTQANLNTSDLIPSSWIKI